MYLNIFHVDTSLAHSQPPYFTPTPPHPLPFISKIQTIQTIYFLFTDLHISRKRGVWSQRTSTQSSINILRTLHNKEPVMGSLE